MKFSDLDSAESSRYLMEARLEIDRHTANRLRNAEPDDELAEGNIECCTQAVAEALFNIAQATVVNSGTVNGIATVGPVTSVSAGSESMSFKAPETVYTAAARDSRKRDELVYDIIRRYLSEVTVGGVCVLYCGVM